MTQVRYDREGPIARIFLDGPPVNALTLSTIEAIIEGLRRAGGDPEVRAVVLATAIPRYFSAGLDLNVVLKQPAGSLRATIQALYPDLLDAQHALGKPCIAAVSGAARGGGMTLAVSCNLIIAGEGATFGYPEIEVGMLPAIHLGHLPRIIGRHRAFDLLFSGRAFSAHEARDLGLVSRVVPDGQLMDQAMALARAFAAKSPTAMTLGHAAFMDVNDAGYRDSARRAVDLFCDNAETPAGREGLAAFVERRPPDWS